MVTCRNREKAEIVSLAVNPDYRRRGLAGALMHSTLRSLRRTGARRVSLMVRPANHAAHTFYRSFGFRRVRLARGYYEDGGDAIIMARALQ
jgi:[ribosomal protein S18]-alanine N-acetyltransferase